MYLCLLQVIYENYVLACERNLIDLAIELDLLLLKKGKAMVEIYTRTEPSPSPH